MSSFWCIGRDLPCARMQELGWLEWPGVVRFAIAGVPPQGSVGDTAA